MNKENRILQLIRKNEIEIAQHKYSALLDISYWQTSDSPLLESRSRRIARYTFSEHVNDITEMLIEHFGARESSMTLVGGGTIGNLTALKIAKDRFIGRGIDLLAPYYYATPFAATALGYKVRSIKLIEPLTSSARLKFRPLTNERQAIHVTLPMFGFGAWPDEAWLDSLCQLAESGVPVITDESNSCLKHCPLDAAIDRNPQGRDMFIRVRGVAKPLLLGGVRIAAIEHAPQLSEIAKEVSNSLSGGLSASDVSALRMLTRAEEPIFDGLKKSVLEEIRSVHRQICDVSNQIWQDGPISPLLIFGISESTEQFEAGYLAAAEAGVVFRCGNAMNMPYNHPAYGRVSLPLGVDVLKNGIAKVKEAFGGYRVVCY